MPNTQLIPDLVRAIQAISAELVPDPHESLIIRKLDDSRNELGKILGAKPPESLVAFYGTTDLCEYPCDKIVFSKPKHALTSAQAYHYQQEVEGHWQPICAEAGVKTPARMGNKLVAFAYHYDSFYCVDMDPDLATGGVLEQIVHVSFRKGVAKVVFPNMESFLANVLKQAKKQLAAERKAALIPPPTPEELERERQWYIVKAQADVAKHLAAMGQQPAPPTPEQAQQKAEQLISTNPQLTPLQRACAHVVQALTARVDEYTYDIQSTEGPMPASVIAQLEKKLRVTFPPDLREFLSTHAYLACPSSNMGGLGVLQDVVKDCKDMNAIVKTMDEWATWPGTVDPVFGKHLIPVSQGQPVYCYDLAPSPEGIVGQIVEVYFANAECKVIAPSLLTLIEAEVAALTSGTSNALIP